MDTHHTLLHASSFRLSVDDPVTRDIMVHPWIYTYTLLHVSSFRVSFDDLVTRDIMVHPWIYTYTLLHASSFRVSMDDLVAKCMKGKAVMFHCDNQPEVHAIQRGERRIAGTRQWPICCNVCSTMRQSPT